MFPYWLLFTVFAAGSLQHRRGGLSNWLLGLAGLFVALMIGLRFEVGGDWGGYERMLASVRYMDLGAVLAMGDPGYMALNWLAIQIGAGIWFVNLVAGLIFTWGLIRLAKRQPNPWLACLVAVPYLIIVVAMGYTRQGLAIGVIMAGLSVVDRRSLLRFSFYILVAASFHKTALIVIPLVALASTRNRIANIGLLALTGLLLYYLFLEESVDTLVTNYIDAEYASQGAAIRVAMNLPPAALFFAMQRSLGFSDQQRLLWRNFSVAAFAALAALILVGEATTAVDRIALYLIPLQLVILSRLPYVRSLDGGTPNGQLLLAVMFYSAAVQFVWLTYATHSRYWLPYQLWGMQGAGSI